MRPILPINSPIVQAENIAAKRSRKNNGKVFTGILALNNIYPVIRPISTVIRLSTNSLILPMAQKRLLL